MIFSTTKLILGGSTLIIGGLGAVGTTLGTKMLIGEKKDPIIRYAFQQNASPIDQYTCRLQEDGSYNCSTWNYNKGIPYSDDEFQLHRDLIAWRNSRTINNFSFAKKEGCEVNSLFIFSPSCKPEKKD